MPAAHLRTTDLLPIGQVADRSGLATSAIRYYESLGLLHSERNSAGQRRFARSTLRRLAVIRAASKLGVPLANIVDDMAATLPIDHAPTAAQWRQLSGKWRADLDARIEELTTMRNNLDGCIGCGCLSLKKCTIYNTDDQISQYGAGARTIRHPMGVD